MRERRQLSLGDGIAIAALLLFAAGWIFVLFEFTGYGDPVEPGEELSGGAAWLILATIYAPPGFALWQVKEIIHRD